MELPALPPLSPLAGSIYEAAVALETATPEAIARHAGTEARQAVAEIAALQSLGLLEVEGSAVTAVAPRLPLERLALEHARAIDAARLTASAFEEIWTQAANRQNFIEVITDEAHIATVTRELMDDTVLSADALCTGPVSPRTLPPAMQIPPPSVLSGFFEAVERGVHMRCLYGVNVLEDSVGLASVHTCIAAGEEARVLPNVPLNLVIYDRKRAHCAVAGQAGSRRALVVIHESGLLESLMRIFDVFWQMGVPLDTDSQVRDRNGPSASERQLLAYLAAGITDEAIARDLGISARTLGRRIARLERVLGAHNRFQLAVQATRRGWLSSQPQT